MDLIDKIKEQYSSYNTTRKRIALFIIEKPTQCCFLTLKEFAAETNTTEVTVLNFCRALDLDSYSVLKKEIQSHVLVWTRPVDRMKEIAMQSSSADDLFEQIVKAEQKSLRTTFTTNSASNVLAFIEMLKKPKRIFVAAHGVSRIFSMALAYRLSLLGLDISTFDVENTQITIFQLLSCIPEDSLLIAIATPPYGKSTISTAKMCVKRKIPVISITDSTSSPLIPLSETSLVCPTELMGLTNSSVSIMAMIDTIAALFLSEKEEGELTSPGPASEQYESYLHLFEDEE